MTPRGRPKKGTPPAEIKPPPEAPAEGDEEALDESLDEGMLVDQGDGMRVLRRTARKTHDDRETHELPDEPPKGWGDG